MHLYSREAQRRWQLFSREDGKIFGERIFSRKEEFGWPSHFPDLTDPDLWGYLKQRVFMGIFETASVCINKPQIFAKLKDNICMGLFMALSITALQAVNSNNNLLLMFLTTFRKCSYKHCIYNEFFYLQVLRSPYTLKTLKHLDNTHWIVQ